MSKKLDNSYVARIIQWNFPRQTPEYDPEETVIDMAAAYNIARSLYDDPSTDFRQRYNISRFMSWLEMMADKNGIELSRRGHVARIRRSEFKKNTVTYTADPDEVDFYHKAKGLIK